MVFSFQVGTDQGLPAVNRDALNQTDSTDAPDDSTFVVLFRRPYYLAGSLGIRMFQPLPQHLLQEAYGRALL
jgi:hypothetical protein